jgi:hypothetical protein
MDGLDDLGVIDALKVDRGDAEVAVAEWPLDDDQRLAFASHLDRVGVSELVRSETPAHTRCGGRQGESPTRAAGAACKRPNAGAVGLRAANDVNDER